MRTRAAVLWEQPGEWKVQEVELDEPGPTEVLVEMVATGLCYSDDHFATGDVTLRHVPGRRARGLGHRPQGGRGGARLRSRRSRDHLIHPCLRQVQVVRPRPAEPLRRWRPHP